MYHFVPLKHDHRKMDDDTNGGKIEGRVDETRSVANT